MDPLNVLNILNGIVSQSDSSKQQQYQLDLMQKQWEYNQKGMQEQVAAQKELFDYTGPQHRVEQLKAAGLNPGLIYGMGGGGGAVTGSIAAPQVSGGGAPNVAQSTANKTAMLGMMLSFEKLKSEIELNKSAAAVNEASANLKAGAETELTKSQTIGQDIQNKFNEINVEVADRSKEINIEKIETLANQAKVQMELDIQKLIQEKGNSAVNQATIAKRIEQYNANVNETVYRTIESLTKSDLNKQQIIESINSISQRWVDKDLTQQQMKTEIQKVLLQNDAMLDRAELESVSRLLENIIPTPTKKIQSTIFKK